MQSLAASVVRALVKQGYVQPAGSEADLVGRIQTLLLENLRAEQELEEEAERLAERHARQMAGMDQRRIIQGIKERLAKERGFTL